MNIQEMQIKYDILMTQIASLILLFGLFYPTLYDGRLTVILLPLTSAAGLLLLLGYLFTVGWFLELCDKDSDIKANRIKLVAKCCQCGLIVLSAAVVILLALM